MGTHHFSDGFARIHDALREGRLHDARQRVALWADGPADEYTESEIAKVAIEQGILRAHQQVFGVVAWYVFIPAVLGTLLPGGLGLLLSGPGGAVLYRLSTLLDERWGRTSDEAFRAFGEFARNTAQWLEWVPTRLTALSFAIVGDFEDAVYCWRSQASAWTDRQTGILLASGAGALGVRLGEAIHGVGRVIRSRGQALDVVARPNGGRPRHRAGSVGTRACRISTTGRIAHPAARALGPGRHRRCRRRGHAPWSILKGVLLGKEVAHARRAPYWQEALHRQSRKEKLKHQGQTAHLRHPTDQAATTVWQGSTRRRESTHRR
jgi:hypothetical protein